MNEKDIENMIEKKNLILIGPPGSGKGTFTQELKQFHYESISTGNLLRENLAANSFIGQECKDFINSGKLVPDKLIFKLIHEKIKRTLREKTPFVLDGFPQSIIQYHYLLRLLEKEDMKGRCCFLEFIIDDEKAINQMISRLFCLKCHQIYNNVTCPPLKRNTCDKCQCKLVRRSTDNRDDAIKRLKVYRKETKPILALAKKNFEILKINSNFGYNVQLYINFIFHILCTSNNNPENYYDKI
ncbi:MAG: nucleoside monophosphate kinase [Alphaproteobacteria bacterium]|nr:nucleoside monophosphate kinase [Alphaproteobacteria bacterium]